MKKLFFICLIFFCGTAKAGGPYFQQKDPTAQQEFELNYQDIATKISSATALSMISSATTTANASILLATSSISGIELERSSFTVTAATATASTSFVNTTLTCSVTLDAANNTVEFSASGMLDNSGTNNTYWTVTRNGVNLGHATDGLGRAAGQSAGFRYPWSVTLSDSPGATGLATYIVQIKVDAGTGGLCLSGYCKGICKEIKK